MQLAILRLLGQSTINDVSTHATVGFSCADEASIACVDDVDDTADAKEPADLPSMH